MPRARSWLRYLIGSVWIFHGLYSKLLHQIPRHEAIVGRVLGEDAAGWLTPMIGIAEILLGAWVLTAKWPRTCAATQTLALVSMNVLEIVFARDLLLWPAGMVAANLVLIASAWWLAKR
ncbi:DoxX-like family protein [Luteolibacter arcticus]|uniref:DoxX-like family protein n=1 Tax=Luteolibacter arcticus TaxID=1581411 RepID=A0ABT3GDG8_9BACT|nr:DoxX-like family protein [Luteolibacter arcticus]MCW1921463.1 DoxX-like family protein [Luteolibacter arcticus]